MSQTLRAIVTMGCGDLDAIKWQENWSKFISKMDAILSRIFAEYTTIPAQNAQVVNSNLIDVELAPLSIKTC